MARKSKKKPAKPAPAGREERREERAERRAAPQREATRGTRVASARTPGRGPRGRVFRFDTMVVAVDVALVTAFDGDLYTLLVRRTHPPFEGEWALPGAFVREDEALPATATRVLQDKAGISGVFLEQLYTFGSVGRDPRMRVIAVAYYALVDRHRLELLGVDRDDDRLFAKLIVPWPGETGGPVELEGVTPAFDHADILGVVVKRIRGKLNYSPIGFQLLPEAFTLRELQEVHETVLGRALNKDSFRRRMLASGQLEATGERQHAVGHRPAELYRFTRRSAI